MPAKKTAQTKKTVPAKKTAKGAKATKAARASQGKRATPAQPSRSFDDTASEEQLERVRRICFALPGTTEKLSHGEPTFFAHKRVFVMFANNHHNDGHIAVWLPAPPGAQAELIEAWPKTFFYPPYVGVSGWVGIELAAISDEELTAHVLEAWRLIEQKSRKRR